MPSRLIAEKNWCPACYEESIFFRRAGDTRDDSRCIPCGARFTTPNLDCSMPEPSTEATN